MPNGGVPTYDNVALLGGKGFVPPGACCYRDTATCMMAYGSGDCVPGGGVYHGNGVSCEEIARCPSFLPDHDLDGDVDITDFGWFQQCLTEEATDPPSILACECADFNNDGKVNQSDLPIFLQCLSGPDIPADPACAN